jgi:hypothetical protein
VIAKLQKIQLLKAAARAQIQDGRMPHVGELLGAVSRSLAGRRWGAPFARLRAAVWGLPIGGEDGQDITRTFDELKEDVDLLYAAQIRLAAEALDRFDIFAARKDRLAQKLTDLTAAAETMLAQQSAGSRAAVVDSFTSLEKIDPDQSTVEIDLEEGTATLAADALRSQAYDGSRVQLVSAVRPLAYAEPGAPFDAIFSPYRSDAWYGSFSLDQQYQAIVNATGLDPVKGTGSEISLNALRIEPTRPLNVKVEWSADGLNFNPFDPIVERAISARATFHFNPVPIGFLRFTLTHVRQPGVHAARQQQLGIRKVELLTRGFSPAATLVSKQYQLNEVVHTVAVHLDQTTPFGTKIVPYLAQAPTGPWIKVGAGPVTFDTLLWVEQTVATADQEDPDLPATFWEAPINPAAQPLPGAGELIAGRDQVRLDAYPFDWKKVGDRAHIPERSDWDQPLAEVRSGVFVPLGQLDADPATADAIAASGFTGARNPLAVDLSGDGYLTAAVLDVSGRFVLQPGYCYRLTAAVWCPVPTTLERQRLGVVNPAGEGGQAGAVVAPLSFWVNGRKVYQSQGTAVSVDALSGASYQTSVSLIQGWNTLELMLQLPDDLAPGAAGLARTGVHVYFQPNLFSPAVAQAFGIQEVRAWQDPWKRVSEFDLRYNTPPGVRSRWAWKTDVSDNTTTAVLLNHDPTNSRSTSDLHPSYTTVDGTNASYPVNLILRYPTERAVFDVQNPDGSLDPRSLYFRADFQMDPGSPGPPVLNSYSLVVN